MRDFFRDWGEPLGCVAGLCALAVFAVALVCGPLYLAAEWFAAHTADGDDWPWYAWVALIGVLWGLPMIVKAYAIARIPRDAPTPQSNDNDKSEDA